MAKCKNCGRHVMFLVLKNGLCPNCYGKFDRQLKSIDEKMKMIDYELKKKNSNEEQLKEAYGQYMKYKDLDAVIADYERIFDNDPDGNVNIMLRIRLVEFYQKAGDYDKAWDYLNLLLTLYTHDTGQVRYAQYKQLKKEKKDYADALKYLTLSYYDRFLFIPGRSPNYLSLFLKEAMPLCKNMDRNISIDDLKNLQEKLDYQINNDEPLSVDLKHPNELLMEQTFDAWLEDLEKASSLDDKIKEIRSFIDEEDWHGALQRCEHLIDDIEERTIYLHDEKTRYVNYREEMELVLTYNHLNEDREIVPCEDDYSTVYHLYGVILVELQQYQKAEDALLKAKEWNPSRFDTQVELAEIQKIYFKLRNNPVYLEEFFDQSKDLFEVAFHKVDFARCYRNIGFYLSEKKQPKEALCALALALKYSPENEITKSEIDYAASLIDGEVKAPTKEEIIEFTEKCDIPCGLNGENAILATQMGMYYLRKTKYNKEKALYYLNIAYELTDDDGIKQIIDNTNAGEYEPRPIEPLKIPKQYKLEKGYHPVKAYAPEETKVYSYSTNSANAILVNYEVDEVDSMPFDDLDSIKQQMHDEADENTGLIEVGNGKTNNGLPYVYDIIKHHLSEEDSLSGVEYTLNINIKMPSGIQFINCSFAENGVTGMRESLTSIALAKEKGIDLDELMEEWSYDPYFPDDPKGFLKNLSEEERFDKTFPDHPLSLAHAFLEAIKESN